MNLVTPDSGLIFWTTLIFVIVFIILAKVGFPVITGMVEKRKEEIEGSIKKAELAQKELEELARTKETLINEAKKEQAKILSEASIQRQAILDKSKDDAQKQASDIIEKARKDIVLERENAMRDLRAQVGKVSVGVAEKILKKELEDKNLQEDYIDKVMNEMLEK